MVLIKRSCTDVLSFRLSVDANWSKMGCTGPCIPLMTSSICIRSCSSPWCRPHHGERRRGAGGSLRREPYEVMLPKVPQLCHVSRRSAGAPGSCCAAGRAALVHESAAVRACLCEPGEAVRSAEAGPRVESQHAARCCVLPAVRLLHEVVQL